MSEDKNAELNNLRYKTGCLRSTTTPGQRDPDAVDQILEIESSSNSGKPWQRLNQTERVAKLKAFAEDYCTKNEMGPVDVASLTSTLLRGLEHRRLTGARDVSYDPTTGAVCAIPALTHHTSPRRFTLKRADRRVSTLKSLGTGTSKSKRERARVRARHRKPRRGTGAGSEIDPSGQGS